MPPSPLAPGEKLTCVSYTPFHGDQSPFELPDIPDEQIRSMFMRPFAGVQDAVEAALAAQGPDAKVLFLTEASITVPRVREV